MAQMQLRRWETETRYYECRIYEDLFGQSILVAANGGKGLRLGMVRVVAVGQEEIDQALCEIAATRLRHGYRESVTVDRLAGPAPDFIEASGVAQSVKRVRHQKVQRARCKRHPIVIHD
jgi:hypothetical protein